MELSLTIKVKLKLSNPKDALAFQEVCEQYRQAGIYVSDYVFHQNFELNSIKLNEVLYHDVRQRFHLKSQLTQSTFRTVTARYKAVQTQLRRNPNKYDSGKKDGDGKEVHMQVQKDLNWLWHPILFSQPQADLVRNRDWSIFDNGKTFSINTLKGRVKCGFFLNGFEEYFDGTWAFGLAKLVKSGKHWFLHISVKKEIAEMELTDVKHVVGIDRGLRQLVTTYDEKDKTTFFNGNAVLKKRRHYKELRRSLQARNTRNSKRRIRKMESRENRWMADVNHCLSKTLVFLYGSDTVFVLEDLIGVRFATEQVAKSQRYEHVSWAFFQFGQMLTYKANKVGSMVVEVSAAYTSQRCPKCGTIKKSNRDTHNHEYHCPCGYRSNDDRVGAMNIKQLGTEYVSGVANPKFEKQQANS